MALKITTQDVEGVTVIVLEGHVVLGDETSSLRDKVKALLAEGKKKMILNMGNVTMIDSSGLGALVAAYSSAKAVGASVRLCNLGSRWCAQRAGLPVSTSPFSISIIRCMIRPTRSIIACTRFSASSTTS